MFLLNPYLQAKPPSPNGDQVFAGVAADSTQTWNCPANVFFVHVVCVSAGGTRAGTGGGGGGALAWKNNIPVVPGTGYTVFIGRRGLPTNSGTAASNQCYFNTPSTVCAGGATNAGVGGQVLAGDGGGAGGNGVSAQGGGGAGGYTGAGGNGNNGHPGSGGGGGGGGTDGTHGFFSGGGGVGLYGEGTSGAGATAASPNGKGGSPSNGGGTNATGGNVGGVGTAGLYGGGGGGASNGGGSGNFGAVRIVWGDNRSFPSTLVDTSTA